MILQLALVSAKLHFHADESRIERMMCVLALAFRFENCAGIQMQRAVGAKERTVVGEHDIRLGSAVKVLSDNIFQTGPHADRKRLTDLYLFT